MLALGLGQCLGFTFYIQYFSTKPNCTLLVHYYHVTGGVLIIRFQMLRPTSISGATAFFD